MTRIKILDLPRLEDLSPEQLKELFGAGPRTFRPSIESLEDRLVQSTFGVLSTGTAVSGSYLSNLSTTPSAQTSGWVDLGQEKTGIAPITADWEKATAVKPSVDYGAIFAPDQNFLSGEISLDTGVIAIANKVSANRTALGQPLPGFEDSLPMGGAQLAPAGGLFRAFQGGSIYWSSAAAKFDIDQRLDPTTAGAHLLAGLMRDKFLLVGGTSELGYPTSDTSNLKGRPGAIFNNFLNPDGVVSPTDYTPAKVVSTLVYSAETNAQVVSGAIRSKWIELGGGEYGLPTGARYFASSRYLTVGASVQDFARGVYGTDAVIVSSPDTGTHDVTGRIFDKLIRSGGLAKWGLPTTDATVRDASGNHSNAVVHFRNFDLESQDSAIGTPSPGAGAFIVHGFVYTAWWSLGGEKFGLPTSDEELGPDQDFNPWVGDTPGNWVGNTFRSSDGIKKAIYWNGSPAGNHHFEVDYGYGSGLQRLDFTPKAGPSGLESIPATKSLLFADPLLDPASNPLSASSFEASTESPWQGSAILQGPADYASLLADGFASQTPEQLQFRLGELDEAVAQSQQELQGALDLQAQYTVERDRIDADIQAVIEVSPDETASNLADLQASQAQIVTALAQNQQQIELLQTQLDLYATEQALIGNALARGDVAAPSPETPAAPKAAQTIALDAIADGTYGDAPILLNATADSGLAVTYQVLSGPATIQDNLLTFTGAGVVTVEATQAGDDNFDAATPVDLSFTVNKAHLTVAADNQTRTFGQADPDFTANITGFVNGETLDNSGVTGAAGLSTEAAAASPVGNYAITASLGSLTADNYDFTDFVGGSINVAKAGTTVALNSSIGSALVGQQIMFTATVAADGSAAIPVGTVTFKDGSTTLGTGTLSNGVATFKAVNLAAGSHAITAVYAGTSDFTSSTSSSLAQNVVQASKTTLQSSLATSTFGHAVTLTATVTPATRSGTPTGTVTFMDGAATLGTATLSGGKATLTTALIGAGSHALTAVYGGNATLATSTSANLALTVKKAAVNLALASSASTVAFGQTVTLTIRAGASMPTGTVTVKDGTTVLGTATFINGVAVFNTAKLSKGKHTLTAVFGGDANFAGSTSAALLETVK